MCGTDRCHAALEEAKEASLGPNEKAAPDVERARRNALRAHIFQYFAFGFAEAIQGLLPGFFFGYLALKPVEFATTHVIIMLPWSFKFIFGALQDFVPLFGYHRKSYMLLGWLLALCCMIGLCLLDQGTPYFCRNDNGTIISDPAADLRNVSNITLYHTKVADRRLSLAAEDGDATDDEVSWWEWEEHGMEGGGSEGPGMYSIPPLAFTPFGSRFSPWDRSHDPYSVAVEDEEPRRALSAADQEKEDEANAAIMGDTAGGKASHHSAMDGYADSGKMAARPLARHQNFHRVSHNDHVHTERRKIVPCNPDARDKSPAYTILMFLFVLCLMSATVAADGWTHAPTQCTPTHRAPSISALPTLCTLCVAQV